MNQFLNEGRHNLNSTSHFSLTLLGAGKDFFCSSLFLCENETNLACRERWAWHGRSTESPTVDRAHGAVGCATRTAGGGVKLIGETDGGLMMAELDHYKDNTVVLKPRI